MTDFKLNNIFSFINEGNSTSDKYLSDFFELKSNPKLEVYEEGNNIDAMTNILKQKEIDRNIDDRPSVSINTDKYSNVIEDKTKNVIDNNKLYDSLNKNETIFDMTLNEIFYNITNVFNNFSKEYNSQLLLAQYKDPINKNISVNNKIDGNTNISSLMKTHFVAFINYLKNNNTILYFGLILILLSLIIYIFNITIW